VLSLRHPGTRARVNEAEKAAKESLPAVADLLGAPASVLTSHEGMGGPGVVDDAAAVQRSYTVFTEFLGIRQRDVAGIAMDTAAALQDVINLYRRADGQV
jgi:hypothetical protein